MGYDMRFYIVSKTSMKGVEKCADKRYAQIIAMFEYCVEPTLDDYVNKVGVDTDAYIIIEDDDILKDKYGEPLKELTIDQMLEFFKNDKANEDYRRQKPFAKLLEGFKENLDKFEDLVVLRYGH